MGIRIFRIRNTSVEEEAQTLHAVTDNMDRGKMPDFTDNYSVLAMEDELKKIADSFVEDTSKYEPRETFVALCLYYRKYDRVLYSSFSEIIYSLVEDDYQTKTMIETNIKALIGFSLDNEKLEIIKGKPYLCSDKEIEKTKKAAYKIWDFTSLSSHQKAEWTKNDRDLSTKVKQTIDIESKSLNSQLITMVSIFTALSFLVNGGLAIAQVSFDDKMPLSKIMCIIFSMGLIFVNMIFVFLFCTSKMTHLKFKSSPRPDANYFQRYPVVAWANYILTTCLAISLMGYYFTVHQSFANICIGAVIAAFMLCLLLLVALGKLLISWSKDKDPRNDMGEVVGELGSRE